MKRILAISAFGLLGGCAIPAARLPSAGVALPERFTATQAEASVEDVATWWDSFGDPELTKVIELALEDSPQIDAAVARVRQARASLLSSRANLVPDVSGSAAVDRSESITRDAGSQTGFQAGLDASYEIDIFGGIGASIRGADASVRSAQASLGDAQRLLAAETALNYVLYRQTQARLVVARSNLGFQTETTQIADWRVQAGLASSLDYEQSRAQLAQTAAAIPTLEAALAGYANRLATLTGQAAGTLQAELAQSSALPEASSVPAAGVPADLLRRRPDVLAAQYQALSAAENVGVSRAQLYPSLRLGGSLGASASSATGLLDALLGGLVANLTGPIFDGGSRRAAVDSALAQADSALSSYRSTVLNAVEEAQNALVSLETAERRLTSLATAAEAAENARTLASSQYGAGLIDFRTLLDAERTLLSAQDSLASARADRSTAYIQLYKALGGGWPGRLDDTSDTLTKV